MISKEELEEQYKKNTDSELAKIYKVSSQTIRRWRKNYNINGKKRESKLKYKKEDLIEAVKNSFTVVNVIKLLKLKQTSYNHRHISERIKFFNIDTSHFTGKRHNIGKVSNNKKTWEEVLVLNHENSKRIRSKLLRRCLKEYGKKEKCKCGITNEWNGKFIQLEINHINEKSYDNRPSNLEFICPNCHSQKTYKKIWCL